MKNVLLVAILALVVSSSFGQNLHVDGVVTESDHSHEKELKTYKKAFSSGKKIHFKMERMTLVIEGYSGSDVIIETYHYQAPPKRARGLRPLYNSAMDNTNVGLQVELANGIMTVQSASHNHMHFNIKVPSNVAIQIEENSWEGNDFEISDVKGEIEIDAKGSSIDIKGARGPIVANTTSGDITVVFETLNQQKPSSISNTSGFIDVALPSNTKANLILDSMTGEVYTDHNLQFEEGKKDGLEPISRKKVNAKLNNGGVELSLKTISDHIYLRKK